MPTQQDIEATLADLPTPLGRPLGESGLIGGIVVREDRVFVSIEAKEVEPTAIETLRATVESRLKAVPGIGAVFVLLRPRSRQVQRAHARRRRAGISTAPSPVPGRRLRGPRKRFRG